MWKKGKLGTPLSSSLRLCCPLLQAWSVTGPLICTSAGTTRPPTPPPGHPAPGICPGTATVRRSPNPSPGLHIWAAHPPAPIRPLTLSVKPGVSMGSVTQFLIYCAAVRMHRLCGEMMIRDQFTVILSPSGSQALPTPPGTRLALSSWQPSCLSLPIVEITVVNRLHTSFSGPLSIAPLVAAGYVFRQCGSDGQWGPWRDHTQCENPEKNGAFQVRRGEGLRLGCLGRVGKNTSGASSPTCHLFVLSRTLAC